MNIKSAAFFTSATTLDGCPNSNLHEFAFIGRSNVGKSSLINALTGRKDLAMVSATPGRTQLINFFTINNKWSLVDLPGYGYARTPKNERAKFQVMIMDYLTKRPNLLRTFVLIDSRLEPQAIDLEFLNWLMSKGAPVALVFTKADKQSKTATQKNIDTFLAAMSEWCGILPPYFVTSSKTRDGRKELLDYMGKNLNFELPTPQES